MTARPIPITKKVIGACSLEAAYGCGQPSLCSRRALKRRRSSVDTACALILGTASMSAASTAAAWALVCDDALVS